MNTPKVSRRQFVTGSASLLAMLGVGGLAGCSGGTSGAGSAAAGGEGIVLGDTLTIISLAGNDGFNPALSTTGSDKVTMHSIFDNLFMFDAEGNCQPMLADSFEQNGKDITITLKSDVVFSDGNPVTADDVVFSYQLYVDDPSNGPWIQQYIAGIDKVDDTTVIVHSVRDDEIWKNILAESVYVLEAATFDAEANDYTAMTPTGSGAYIFESVDSARTVTLKANEEYWGGSPEFKTVVVNAPVDASTSLVALQTGEANYVCQLALTSVVTAEEDPNLEVMTFDSWSQQLLGVLVGDQPFRQAIFHAINRQNILDICNNGEGTPAVDMFSKKIMGDMQGSVEFVGYDVDLAKECIAQTETDLSQTFTITTFDAADVAQCIQQDLAEIGINVEVAEVDVNTWSQGLTDQTLQMFVTGLGTDMLAVDSFIELLMGDSSIYYYPISEELKNKIREMMAIPSTVDRRDACIEIMGDMAEECPIVPLYDKNYFDVYTKGIGGTLPSSTGTYVYYIGDFTNEQ